MSDRRQPRRRVCAATGKVKFKRPDQALAAAATWTTGDARAMAYRCAYGGHWHCSSHGTGEGDQRTRA